MSTKKIKRSRHNERLSIPEFFEGKNVFITGATGFMGKVLVEKLLRSCPDIGNIYILMRPKNGKSLEERLKMMTSLPLFIKVKRENKGLIEKIVPLRGDVSEPQLGLSESDIELLEKEISVVFHVAASVRFDDPLKKSTLMNTTATVELVKLATGMEKLESFLHVSTTYCNIHKSVIEEKIYPAPADWRNIVKLADNLDSYTLEVFSQKILGVYPNTYTFTKALAEHVVYDYRDYIPAAIFRPSIVISSMTEPMPGWVDNFNGPVGLIVASGKGIVRSVYSDPDIRSDFMPVDLAVKAMITVAWDRATRPEPFPEPPVYNCSSHEIKSITQKEIVEIGHYVTREVPLNDILWLPGGHVTKSKLLHFCRVLLFHLIPGLIIDTMLTMSNRKPMLLRLHRKIYVANLALEYFITRQWSFKNDKLMSLADNLLEEDKPAFGYVVHDVDVIDYFRNCTYGARQYLLHEDNAELPEAKKHYRKMYWIDKAANATFLLFLGGAAVRLRVIHALSYLLRMVYTLLFTF